MVRRISINQPITNNRIITKIYNLSSLARKKNKKEE
jgi:hypothetical protein